jgi:hypothetical protein
MRIFIQFQKIYFYSYWIRLFIGFGPNQTTSCRLLNTVNIFRLQVKINESCIVGVQSPVPLKYSIAEVKNFALVFNYYAFKIAKIYLFCTAAQVFLNEIEYAFVVFEESLYVFDNCLAIIRIYSANRTGWFLSSTKIHSFSCFSTYFLSIQSNLLFSNVSSAVILYKWLY